MIITFTVGMIDKLSQLSIVHIGCIMWHSFRFYLGCDSCQGWFHPVCVGVAQQDAKKDGAWHCHACTSRIAGDPANKGNNKQGVKQPGRLLVWDSNPKPLPFQRRWRTTGQPHSLIIYYLDNHSPLCGVDQKKLKVNLLWESLCMVNNTSWIEPRTTRPPMLYYFFLYFLLFLSWEAC